MELFRSRNPLGLVFGQMLGGEGFIGALEDLIEKLVINRDRARLELAGETADEVNGKSLEGLVQGLTVLRNTLDEEMAGLFATDVVAIDQVMSRVSGNTFGELKASIDETSLLTTLTKVRDRVIAFKEANADTAAKLAEVESEVSEVIADITALQGFEPDTEEVTEKFEIEIKGPAKGVKALLAQLQAIVDAAKETAVIESLAEKARAGAKYSFDSQCWGLNVLGANGLFEHRHYDFDLEVLKAKLAEAGVELLDAEVFDKLLQERQAAHATDGLAEFDEEDLEDEEGGSVAATDENAATTCS